jgi:hypothetical protein
MDEWIEEVKSRRRWNIKNDEIKHKNGKNNFIEIWKNEQTLQKIRDANKYLADIEKWH